jgi:hypothetical protein
MRSRDLRTSAATLLLVTAAGALSAQSTSANGVPPAAQQVAAAVLPLPATMQAAATVLGYGGDGMLVRLRQGTNGMVCLADSPTQANFHVACYHESLEPFMARGRALRAEGVERAQVDTVRFAEIKSGKLKMPNGPAALYSLTGDPGSYDPVTNAAKGARLLYVVYIPSATVASTGLPARPDGNKPWIMFPGTPKAHIMFTPDMD